jgi:hypothetical protein
MRLPRFGFKAEALWMLIITGMLPLAGIVIVLVVPLIMRGCAPVQP